MSEQKAEAEIKRLKKENRCLRLSLALFHAFSEQDTILDVGRCVIAWHGSEPPTDMEDWKAITALLGAASGFDTASNVLNNGIVSGLMKGPKTKRTPGLPKCEVEQMADISPFPAWLPATMMVNFQIDRDEIVQALEETSKNLK